MSPAGRPAIGPALTVRFDPETRAKLDRLASERGCKVADVVRDLVAKALEGRP